MNDEDIDLKKYVIAFIIFVICILFLIRACSSKDGDNNIVESNYYTVSFDSDGGSLVKNQIIDDGGNIIRPEDPIKEGYRFIGWELDGELYNFDSDITENIKLIAIWEKLEDDVTYIRIRFDTNGGSVVSDQLIKLGEVVVKPSNPYRKGYKFIGWFNDSVKFDFDTLVENDITLVARWKKNVTTTTKVDTNVSDDKKEDINYVNTLKTDKSTLKFEIDELNEFEFHNSSSGILVDKSFVVSNLGDLRTYYALVLTDLINTYEENQILIASDCISYSDYDSKKVSGTCNGFNKYIGTYNDYSQELLLDGVLIEPGYTHVYNFKISAVNINDVNNKAKVFSGKIDIVQNTIPEIFDVIKRDNEIFADNVNSTFVKNDVPGIDFTKQGGDTNGKGLYYTASTDLNEDVDGDGKGEVVYYYRGDVKNNNLVFGGFCWKIVRTNEDGSFKLRYSGKYDDINKCTVVSSIGNSYFNNTYGDNAYAGYMMGLDNQCTDSTCSGSIRSTSYEEAHSNKFDSTVKKVIDKWYEDNILPLGKDVTSKIANTIYCNDRSITTAENGYTGNNSQEGFSNKVTTYNTLLRVEGNMPLQFKCNQKNDEFTLSVEAGGVLGYGNNALKYPVALMTGDEFAYAGNKNSTKTLNNYLYYDIFYWSMSPGSASATRVGSISLEEGAIYNDRVVYAEGVFPAISLKSDVLISSGTGIDTDPYIVK